MPNMMGVAHHVGHYQGHRRGFIGTLRSFMRNFYELMCDPLATCNYVQHFRDIRYLSICLKYLRILSAKSLGLLNILAISGYDVRFAQAFFGVYSNILRHIRIN